MLKKIFRDVSRRNITIPIPDDLNSQRLGYYYFAFEEDIGTLNKLIANFDQDGIPMNASYIDVEDEDLYYYPISIGQFALAVFHSFLRTKDESKRDHFLRIAEWFYENRQEDEQLGAYWLTSTPKPEYGVFHPWKSAFSQSRALSVLLRAWQLTGNQKYLDVATLALNPFCFDISKGGVSVDRDRGRTFYEEYVASKPTRVLDGHSFSLFGIYDFVRAVQPNIDKEAHELARKIFLEGIEGLVSWLPDFDLGYWVRFNYCELEGYPKYDPCTINYLRVVTTQLDILYRITGEEILKKFADKFRGYRKPANIMKMYGQKYRSLRKLNRL